MHEIGVAQSIIEMVIKTARQNDADAIKAVGLKIGAMSGIEIRSLEFALECIKADTIAANATFIIDKIPAVGICGECGKRSTPDTFFSLCKHCGSPTLEIVSGKEFNIDYIDI